LTLRNLLTITPFSSTNVTTTNHRLPHERLIGRRGRVSP
jgi:hypothetical protein